MKKEFNINIPILPGYIFVDSFNEGKSISEFSNEELEEIGKMWTEELIKKARAIK